jgi:hypothetical protein
MLAVPGVEQTNVVFAAVGSRNVPDVAVQENVVPPPSGLTSTVTATLAPTAATTGAMTSEEINRHSKPTVITAEPLGVVHCNGTVRMVVWFAGTTALPDATHVVVPSVDSAVTVTEYSRPAGSIVNSAEVVAGEPTMGIVFRIGAIPSPLSRKVSAGSDSLDGNKTSTDRSPVSGRTPGPQLAHSTANQAIAKSKPSRYD